MYVYVVHLPNGMPTVNFTAILIDACMVTLSGLRITLLYCGKPSISDRVGKIYGLCRHGKVSWKVESARWTIRNRGTFILRLSRKVLQLYGRLRVDSVMPVRLI